MIICIVGTPIPISYAARSISITSPTTSLYGDEHIVLTASASGFIDGETIYIKGAFFQIGSSNYFGYSKSEGDSWVKNGETARTQPMAIMGTWDNQLIVKSDFSDGGYNGEGEYGLKLGFYYTTGSNTLSAVNWSTNILTVTLSEPDPTNTQIPTSTLTPTSSSTPTSTIATVHTPTNSPSPKTSTPTVVQTLFSPSVEPSASDILGTYTQSVQREAVEVEDTGDHVEKKEPSPIVFALLFIGVGTAMLACGLSLEKVQV